jgi:hypothetical protein
MSQQREGDARRRKRTQGMFGALCLCIGVGVLLNALGNPRVAALHATDIIQLFCSGILIGSTLVLLVGFFLGGFGLGPRASRTETPPSQTADRQAAR